MERLSSLLGEDFIVTCRAVKSDTHSDIQKRAVDINKKGDIKDIDPHEMRVLTLIEGIINPNLKDEQLRNHFGAATPKILVEKLFLAGEIVDIYNLISNLSGFEEDDENDITVDDEIKNS